MIIFLIKNWKSLLTGAGLIVLLGFFYWASNQVRENQKLKCEVKEQSEKIKQQKTETKVKDEIITTKNYQEKLIHKTSNSTNTSDRAKWLQLIYAKGNSSQN